MDNNNLELEESFKDWYGEDLYSYEDNYRKVYYPNKVIKNYDKIGKNIRKLIEFI